jgi:hypothetical protein
MIDCPHCGKETTLEDMREGVCLDCHLLIHSSDVQMVRPAPKQSNKPTKGENDAFACFGVDLQ